MIEALITSKTRIKLLLKFFLNPDTLAHLRGLENEFGESTNAIRLELNKLEEANMLLSETNGKKKIFRVNTAHPLFADIHSIIKKFVGLDIIIENVVKRLGKVERVYVTGALAKGIDASVIDLVIVGDVDKPYLLRLIEKVEPLIHRKIRFLVYTPNEPCPDVFDSENYLLLWHNP